MMRMVMGIAGLVFLSASVFAQSASGPADTQAAKAATAADAHPTFVIADAHASAHTRYAHMMGPVLRGDRYLLRQATMRDMVAIAYNVVAGFVSGGPVWLEANRYDVYAKMPPGTTQDQARLMLRALLVDRFNLAARETSISAPARVLVVSKDGVKMKQATGSEDDSGCRFKPLPELSQGAVPTMTISCHNISMAAFVLTLHNFTYDYWPGPIGDATGLKGTWNFDLKWSNRSQLAMAGAEGIPVTDAVEKQLGLVFASQMQPRPVIMVDNVNEAPTPNAPDLAKILPPLPPPEIEVATIKPSKPDERLNIRFNGLELNIQGATLRFLIYFAWDLNMSDDEVLAGAPKWLDSDRYDIVAKMATDSAGSVPQGPPFIDIDDLRHMLRGLLVDRFGIQTHIENQPINGFILTAPNPKLTKADPTSHTRCGNVVAPGEKDPRLTNPALDRLVTCQNMTMAQIADEFQELDGGYINSDVQDATGIKGSWDFTLAFSSSWVIGAGGGGLFPASAPPPAGSDPNGAVSFFDAVNKQLGLKFEKQKRPLPVLVIDHIEEKPTEN